MDCLFFTEADVASLLGLTERSVYRLKRNIPGYVKVGGRVLYRKSIFMKATLGTQEPEGEAVSGDDRHGLT